VLSVAEPLEDQGDEFSDGSDLADPAVGADVVATSASASAAVLVGALDSSDRRPSAPAGSSVYLWRW
jgi:hypothetical protein